MADLKELWSETQKQVTEADEARKKWIIEKSDGEIKKIGDRFDYSKVDKYLMNWRDGRDFDMLNITVWQLVLYNNLLCKCYEADKAGKVVPEKEFISVKKSLQEKKKQLENDILVVQNEMNKLDEMLVVINTLRGELGGGEH